MAHRVICMQLALRILFVSVCLFPSTLAQFHADRYSSSRSFGDATSDSKHQKNTLGHITSKSDSSASSGVHEADIESIFRRIAYGEPSLPSTTTPPTTSSTTTTTTTTTTQSIIVSAFLTSTNKPNLVPKTKSTTIKTSTKSASDKKTTSFEPTSRHDRWNGFRNDDSPSNSFSNAWTSSSSDDSQQIEKLTAPPNLYDTFDSLEFNNNILEGGKDFRDIQLSDSGAHFTNNKNYPSKYSNNKDVAVQDVEVNERNEYGWITHVYLTGVLMGVVAAMSMLCITRVHICSPMFPRNFFVAMHILVFLAALCRCCLIFSSSFGEANSEWPKLLIAVVNNIVPPCLTASFSLVLLVYLKATHLYILPQQYQSTFALGLICLVHIMCSVIVGVFSGISDKTDIVNALKAGLHALTAGWGLALCCAYLALIFHLRKNEEVRSIIPKKSLQVIYISVMLECILIALTIFGIASSSTTKSSKNVSLWVVASVERLLEALFCVTLLVITTTFTLSKCNNVKQQEQKVFSVMSTGKRDGGLGRSANVYPVTSDKVGFLANGLYSGNNDGDNMAKNENIYSGWGGTIDSATSDFQLLGKGTNTMSTVLYPQFGAIGGDANDDSGKDTYVGNGQESSTSYSTLSSYRGVNSGHMCYCSPVGPCCQGQNGPGFSSLSKQPVMLVSQYSHPQAGSSGPQSEESTSGSSYYGSSLGSSHIYSSPQYYTCPNQIGDMNDFRSAGKPMPIHVHQCSDINSIQTRLAPGDESRHIPTSSLPILQDIPENNARILQLRPKQPLPQQEMQQFHPDSNAIHSMQTQHLHQSKQHPITTAHKHPHSLIHYSHPQHIHLHSHQPTVHHYNANPSSPSQVFQTNPSANMPKNVPISGATVQTPRPSKEENNKSTKVPSSSSSPLNREIAKVNSKNSNHSPSAPSKITNDSRNLNNRVEASDAIQTIEGSDCSFLNKLVRSPEGQILSASLEVDTKRASQRRKEKALGGASPPAAVGFRHRMALDDESLPSQIV